MMMMAASFWDDLDEGVERVFSTTKLCSDGTGKGTMDNNGQKVAGEVAIMLKLAIEETSSVGTSAPVSLLDWYDLDKELILVLKRPDPSEDVFKDNGKGVSSYCKLVSTVIARWAKMISRLNNLSESSGFLSPDAADVALIGLIIILGIILLEKRYQGNGDLANGTPIRCTNEGLAFLLAFFVLPSNAGAALCCAVLLLSSTNVKNTTRKPLLLEVAFSPEACCVHLKCLIDGQLSLAVESNTQVPPDTDAVRSLCATASGAIHGLSSQCFQPHWPFHSPFQKCPILRASAQLHRELARVLSLLPRFHFSPNCWPGGGIRRRNVLAVSVENPFSLACSCCSGGGVSGASDSSRGRLGADMVAPHPDNTQQDNGSAISAAAAETMTVVI
ncbi:hypothetical protein GBF38_020154 [Nibea albiflora]|uniref:Uncharacterized protein n=1 Tax=Nibea albiflora TaxID=240163 RepID=A0ACB7FDW8_NIBAL|nr:hypothetical protein GBF38_020154 [Nibea albiflora]